MKINEIIVNEDRQRVDEIGGRVIASGLGALAGGLLGGPAGAVAGAAGGAWLGQKLKNVFNPDDPMEVSHRRATNITANEILADYREFLKETGGPTGLTPDQVLNWFNQKFRNTTVPGTGVPSRAVGEPGSGEAYVFKNPPTATDFATVSRWLKQEMAQVERDVMTRGPKPPDQPELAPADTIPAIPADGTKFNTNRGEYQVKRGQWVDPSGNPVSTEISNKLSQLHDDSTKMVGLAPFPKAITTVNTSQGQFQYTDRLGRGWNWFKVTGTGTPTPVVDSAVVQRLNEIAQQQATP